MIETLDCVLLPRNKSREEWKGFKKNACINRLSKLCTLNKLMVNLLLHTVASASAGRPAISSPCTGLV